MIDFTGEWSEKTEIPVSRFVGWLGIGGSKFYQWRDRYGKANEHNGKIPRDHWLEPWERQAIIDFHRGHPLEGYRRLTFMMLDEGVVAVSPSSTWRVLSGAGLLRRWNSGPSRKGKGFHQPSGPHRHWHADVAYINIHGTFYYLCSVLDGYSRFIVHWELRESMTEADVEVILQRAKELFPEACPRLITDNGPQFIAKDFKEFIRIAGMTHVRTSPFYPQSNGKIERWHKSVKSEAIRPRTPLSLEDAIEIVAAYIEYYNEVRLHSAIGYVTPKDKLEGREEEIFTARDQKLESAREERRRRRAAQRREESQRREPDAQAIADGLSEAPGGASPQAGDPIEITPAEPDSEPNRATSKAQGSGRIEEFRLRAIRNEIAISTVVSHLEIPTKVRGQRIQIRCPQCGRFHTAMNEQTNLARCFPCRRSFNVIDLVMAERGLDFPAAVALLEGVSGVLG